MESTVDIKDFILIGGGLLIAAVVAHGFWIAWRERRQDLRIDIKPDLIPEEVDEIARLRGELPNGGGRVSEATGSATGLARSRDRRPTSRRLSDEPRAPGGGAF